MSKILILLISFIMFFMTFYCHSKITTNDLPIVDIEANVSNMKKVYLGQFTNNVWYVPLESNLEHPIAWITYLDFSEKFILVTDGRSCLLYDNEGHFIRRIGKNGRGPGEYNQITDIVLMNEKIYIRDLFDLNEFKLDGTFVNKYRNCFMVNDNYVEKFLYMINDSMILGYIDNITGQTKYKALIINKVGDVKYIYRNYIQFGLEPGVQTSRGIGFPSIYKFGNNITFKDPYNDTLFHLNNQYQLIPEYVFNLGKYKEPPYERGKSLDNYDLSRYIFVTGVFQTEKYLIIECGFGKYFTARRLTPLLSPVQKNEIWYNTTIALGIFNKKTEDLVFSEPTSTNNQLFTSGLYNDIDAGPRFMPRKMVNDSTMVMDIRFNKLTEHIASDDFKNSNPKHPNKKKRLEQLTDSLTKTGFDNPILMFVTFEKNN